MTDEHDAADEAPHPQPVDETEPQDTFEIEHDGETYVLPAALKGAVLRRADYTRKTQELADHRRALEQDRQALAAHAQAIGGRLNDHAHLTALDRQLEAFAKLDWPSLAHGDATHAEALWTEFEHTKALRDAYAQAMDHHEAHHRWKADQDCAARMAQTGQMLSREVDGWSPELAAKLTDYAQTHGVTLDELRQADDPRIWKILHRAYRGDQATQKDDAARTSEQSQSVRPAVFVRGGAAGSGGVRDDLGTKEWMQRRNDSVRRGR